jgi:hypothetical protein
MTSRLHKILKAHLNRKNLTKAINTCHSSINLPPKNEGGVGIIEMHNLHNSQVKSLKLKSTTRKIPPTYIELCDRYVNYTPLSLHDLLPQQNVNINIRTQERITMWKSKPLHGRHAYHLETPMSIK